MLTEKLKSLNNDLYNKDHALEVRLNFRSNVVSIQVFISKRSGFLGDLVDTITLGSSYEDLETDLDMIAVLLQKKYKLEGIL